MAYVTQGFRRLNRTASYVPFTINATAVAKTVPCKDCTLSVISGNLWFETDGTTAVSTDFKLAAGSCIDLHIDSSISLISDATGASVQILVWED